MLVLMREARTILDLDILKREADFVPHLPYVRHVDDRIVALENNSYMVIYSLVGRSFETCDNDDLNNWHNKLNIALRSLADDRLSIWTHLIRKPTDTYFQGEFRSDYAAALDRKYSDRLQSKVMYHNEFYVTLIVKPADPLGAGLGFLFKPKNASEEVDEASLALLCDKAKDFEKLFAMCEPRALTLYEHNGVMFSAGMEVLQYVMTGDYVRVPLILARWAKPSTHRGSFSEVKRSKCACRT